MNSTRLPGKALADVCGVPLLRRVVDRAREIPGVDGVVVATAGEQAGSIARYCEEWGAHCFTWDGPENDVLGRFVAVLDHIPGVRYVLRICGDSPLLHPEACGVLLADAIRAGAEYAGYEVGGTPAVKFPTGRFCEVVSASALRRLDGHLDSHDPRREHVTPPLYDGTAEASCLLLPVPDWWRLSAVPFVAVDTPQDLQRARRVCR
jgi:spore coat polysaccharide biosynthesis protein SpsF